MHRTSRHTARLFTAFILSATALLLATTVLRLAPTVQPDPIRDSWQRALDSGAYSFRATVIQEQAPAISPVNVGRASERQEVYLEGRADLRNERTQIRMGANASDLATDAGSVELRIDQGGTFVRQQGGMWEKYPGASDLYAPGGDMLGYLAAVRDVRLAGAEPRDGESLTRYTFRIDGPAFAEYMRDRQQEALARQGKLPPGVTLTPSEQHRKLSGSGELVLGADGLPARQLLVISLPGEAGQSATTRMTIDFDDYGPLQPALPFAWRSMLWATADWLKNVAPQALGLMMCALLALVLVRLRGSRRLIRLLTPLLIVTLLVGPLAQSTRVHAFQEEVAQEAEQIRRQQEVAAAPAPAAQPPQSSPAGQAAQTVANVLLTEVRGDDGHDSDGDGLSDAQELALGTDPQQASSAGMVDSERFAALQSQATAALAIGTPALTSENGVDSDQDGLSDYQEQFLSTSPAKADTDGDSLSDYQEARGFDFNGRRWYTNPLALDSNNDGVVDSLEVKIVNQGLEALNTDNDAEPNAFDRDDDGDGVADSLDISPLQHSLAQGAFSEGNSLWLKLDSLNAGKMVAVDFQIRPQNPRQLWYAMGKLDWPADTEGQLQDRNNSTDEMQFVPMLEILIPANSFSSLPSYTEETKNGKATGAINSPELQAQGVSLRKVNATSIAAYVPLTIVTDRQTGERVAFAGRMLYRGTASWGTAHRVNLVWVVQMRNDEPNNGKLDSPGVVHIYTGEPWVLTGMQLREDHSITGAIIYVDPAAQADAAKRDDTLFTLIGGLERTYLNGRSDLTSTEIVRRFNRTSNAGVSESARWNVPNELLAEAYSYDSQINMARDLTSNRNLAILKTLRQDIQPTLLNIRNEHFRSLNLDSLGSNASWSGRQLTMNLPTNGFDAVPLQTTASVSLASYEYTNGAWMVLSADRAIAAIVKRQLPRLTGDEDLKEGQLVIFRNCLAVLFQSVISLVSTNDRSLLAAASDAAVAQANASLAKKGPSFSQQINNLLGMPEGADGAALIRMLGQVAKGIGKMASGAGKTGWSVAGTYLALSKSFTGKAGYAIGAALIGALLAGLVLAGACMLGEISPEVRDWLYNGGLNMVQHVAVQTATVVSSLIQLGFILTNIAKFGMQTVTKAAVALAVVGAAVNIAVTVGMALYEIFANNLSTGMIMQVVLATVLQVAWTIFLAVLAFVPYVGLILVLVITILDAVFSIILSLILGRAESFSSWLFRQIARLVVDEARYFTIEPKLSGSQFRLISDSLGMSAANTFRFSVNVEPNLKANPDMIGNRWSGSPWSLEQARQRVAVNMGLATVEQQLSVKVGWPQLYSRHWLSQEFKFEPGINRASAIWLNSTYNIPFKQCSLWWCNSYDEIKSNNIKLADRVVFDIFPNTLDAFFTLAARAGGKGLAWDATFPRLRDADFDGVISASDPNDDTWDADGDGLSDAFEIQRRSDGMAFNQRAADSDGDGLNDLQEQLARTYPNLRDSDNDGLGDAEELAGFLRVVGSQPMLIRTSPLTDDSDGDGVGDQFEINPSVVTPLAGWRLNEAAGQKRFADYMGGMGLTCQDPSCPQATSIGGRGGARFDGANDVLSGGADGRYKMGSQMSFAAWVYPTAGTSTAGTLLDRQGEYSFYRTGEGNLAWSFTVPTIVVEQYRLPWGSSISIPKLVIAPRQMDTRIALPANRWAHVTLTFNNGTVTTYLNGVVVHTSSGTNQVILDTNTNANDLLLGGSAGSSRPFAGLMADAQLFARALNASEVKALNGGTLGQSAVQASATPTAEAALAPISVFPNIDDADLIVRPGQTLGYTVTLRHNLPEGRPIRGSVWLNLPSVAGGGSPAVDFELVRAQERSYKSSVTVPASVGSGPFMIDAAIQYQLGEEQTARWQALSFVRADVSAAPTGVALAPAPGWSTPYVQAATAGGRVLLVPTRADALGAALDMGAGADPALACASGACLVAWRDGAKVRAALARGTTVGQSVELGSGGPPAVASDGTGYLVAWNDGTALKARRLDGAGAPTGAVLTLDPAMGSGQRVALIWAKDSYLALYERGPAGQRDIWLTNVSATAASAQLAFSEAAADETAPAIAFNADKDVILAVYLRDGVLMGRNLVSSSTRDESVLLADGGAPLEYAAVSAEGDHFIVAGGLRSGGQPTLVYQAVAPAGNLLGEQQRFVWDDAADRAPALGLACAAGAPCALAVGRLSAPQLVVGQLALSLAEGGAGLITNAAIPSSLKLMVDADAPQASLSSPRDGEYLPASVLTGTLIVGGTVKDASPIDLIEVSLDNGPWQPAEGDTAWAYGLVMDSLSAGAHNLRVRARDVAGNQGPASAPVTFIIDREAPALTVAAPAAEPLRPMLDAGGSWRVRLQGSATDPGAGGQPGSGLREVALRLESPSSATPGEQLVTPDAAGNWQLDYQLVGPTGMEPRITPPTGVYTVSVRAADGAGHLAQTTLPVQLLVDATPPEMSLGDAPADPITQTVTMSGVVTDTGSVTSGVASLEGAFVPQEQSRVQEGARVRLLFDEMAGSQVFFNQSGLGRGASCAGAECPTSEANGRIGAALRFSALQSLALADTVGAADGLTIATWLSGQGTLLKSGQAGAAGYVELTTSRFRLQGTSAACELPFVGLTGAGWQHLVATYDGAAQTVYIDGAAVASQPCAAGAVPAATGQLGPGLDGLLDELYLYERALSAEEASTLQRVAEPTWLSATLGSPNAPASAWQLQTPTGLEGQYELRLRAADSLANASIGRDGVSVWRGMIDTAVPRISLSVAHNGAGALARTVISCRVNDFFLDPASVDCPLPAGTLLERSDTPRRYRAPIERQLGLDDTGSRQIGRDIVYTVAGSVSYGGPASACDSHGRCASATASALPDAIAPLDVLISAPAAPRVLTSLAATSIEGAARSTDSLRSLSIRLEGTEIYSNTWAQGATSEGSGAPLWTPPAEGRYRLEVVATDWADRQATASADLFVDVAAPSAVAFASPVVTTTAVLPSALMLPIEVSDSGVVETVQASTDGSTWTNALDDGGSWLLPLDNVDNPDGGDYSFTLRAVDVANREVIATDQTVTIDLQPPAQLRPTLSVGGAQPLAEGDVVRTAAPRLRLDWPAGSDGSGEVTFLAGWTTRAELELGALSAYPAGAGSHEQVGEDGTIYYAHLVQIDRYGNQQTQTLGPITVDGPNTPDVISIRGGEAQPERNVDTGWMESGCTLVARNSALARKANVTEAITATQQLYATWDDRALRLTWAGTTWGDNEDLYLYLDTVDGGALSAYSEGMPAGQPLVSMPEWFAPDYLLRVDDEQHYTLLRWDGQTWTPAHEADAFTLWFGNKGQPDYLNVYLPFATLGISQPDEAPVQVLAYATEEDSLRLWAVMPANNPLTSQRSVSGPGSTGDIDGFAFTNTIYWEGLAPGSCPSDGQLLADLRFSISAEPAGSIYSVFSDENAAVQDELLDGAEGDLDSESLDYIDNDHPPLRDGQVITYTVHYENVGEIDAEGVQAWLVNWGALKLPGGQLKYAEDGTPYYEQFVPLGNAGTIAAGAAGETIFTAVVDRGIARQAGEDEDWATLDISLHDDSTGLEYAYDWFFLDHPVDITPPEDLAIVEPEVYVASGKATVSGIVWDESAVPLIELELRGAGPARRQSCADPTPTDGEWSCEIDLSGLAHGAHVEVLARATDAAGLISAWTEPQALQVDALPPRIVLDDRAASQLASGVIGARTFGLSGRVLDDGAPRAAEVCVDSKDGKGAQCELVELTPASDGARWSYNLPVKQGVEGQAYALSLTALDAAGNRSQALRYDYVMDTVAPLLVLNPAPASTGLAGAPPTNTITLGGTVKDGVGVTEVVVRVRWPNGTTTVGSAQINGGQWSYSLSLSGSGEHRIYIEAHDRAENVYSVTPFSLRGVDRIFLPHVSRVK